LLSRLLSLLNKRNRQMTIITFQKIKRLRSPLNKVQMWLKTQEMTRNSRRILTSSSKWLKRMSPKVNSSKIYFHSRMLKTLSLTSTKRKRIWWLFTFRVSIKVSWTLKQL